MQVATSGKGSEISRGRQGREGGGPKLPSRAGFSAAHQHAGPAWSELEFNSYGREGENLPTREIKPHST